MTGDYEAHFETVPELSRSTRRAMVDLYLRYYDGSDEARFQSDLDGKSEVLLLRFGRKLIGFSTQEVFCRRWRERDIQVIFSGDTVVERAHWGQQLLAFTWLEHAGRIKKQRPGVPLYWFLIVKGHRTFRYLPVFARHFHPHWSKCSPSLGALADSLARERFGGTYDRERGIVAFPESRGHLKPAFAHPTQEEQSKQAVRFFLERNPGYGKGHELVCLCELAENNLKPMARRIFRRGLR